MKGKKIVLGFVLTVSLTQISSLANTNNVTQNNITQSQNVTNTVNNSVTENATQNTNNSNISNNTNNSNTTNSLDNSTTTNNVIGENITNDALGTDNETNNNDAISTFSLQQDESATNENQRAITKAKKTKSNGIYKIAVGADSSKTIEVAGSDIGNNAKIDIWNYRKCNSTKILFKL